jgi:hypothetical protein
MTNIPGPPLPYTDLLDYYIAENIAKEDEKRRAGEIKRHPLRPSSAGKCSRELAYDLAEYRNIAIYDKELLDPRIKRLFGVGHGVEFSSLRDFNAVPFLERKYEQQTVSLFSIERQEAEKEIVEGSCDSVFFSNIKGEDGEVTHKGVIDIKSAGDGWAAGFQSMWYSNLDKYARMDSVECIEGAPNSFFLTSAQDFCEELGWDDFLCDNIIQLNLYGCSEFMVERGIDHCVIYKVNKRNSDHFEIRWRPDPELFNFVKEKYQRISDGVDEGGAEMVEKDFHLGSLRCRFCSRKNNCWPDEDAVKAYFQTLGRKQWPKDTGYLGGTGKELELLFEQYHDKLKEEKEKKKLESKIVTLLLNNEIGKVRLEDGTCWQVKHLKKDGAVLKRAKL